MEIKDRIKQIKYLRLKPEERFLLEMMNGIKPFTSKNYPESVFWKKDDDILFEQDYKNGWLRCNYNRIWLVLSKKYEYSYSEIQSFVKRIADKDDNLGGLTPRQNILGTRYKVDEDTDLGGLTPRNRILRNLWTVDKDDNLGGLIPYYNIGIDVDTVDKDDNLGGLTPICTLEPLSNKMYKDTNSGELIPPSTGLSAGVDKDTNLVELTP